MDTDLTLAWQPILLWREKSHFRRTTIGTLCDSSGWLSHADLSGARFATGSGFESSNSYCPGAGDLFKNSLNDESSKIGRKCG